MKLTLPLIATGGRLKGASDKVQDVRHALRREVDQLAQVAAQVGRDASAQAGAIAHDAGRQTGTAVNRVVGTAAALAPTVAVMGRQRMRGLGRQAQVLGHELRQVRLTTEPRRTGPNMLPGIALIGGLGIGIGTGIALMYLFDPDRGKRRREMLMGRLARMTRAGREVASTRANAFANRTVGVMAEVRRTVTTGIGVEPEPPAVTVAPLEEWPEGTRVPVG